MIAGAVAILRGISRRAPVVVVAGHLNKMSYALMSALRLRAVADLKGRTIGITGIGVLNIEGGPAARIAALKTGKVHAVPLTPGQRVQAEKDGLQFLLDIRETLT